MRTYIFIDLLDSCETFLTNGAVQKKIRKTTRLLTANCSKKSMNVFWTIF